MSYQQPPSAPPGGTGPTPPPPAPQGGMMPVPPPVPPTRQGFFGQFRGLPWWEIVLIVLPLSLIVVGGLVGGVLGVLAAVGNTYVARSSLSTTAKVLAMLGLLVASYIVWFIVAAAIFAAFRSATSQ